MVEATAELLCCALLCMKAPLSIIQVHAQAHDDVVLVTILISRTSSWAWACAWMTLSSQLTHLNKWHTRAHKYGSWGQEG
jgi:hypothetical protein